MNKILVTGATGNVGRQVVAQLPGAQVRAVARNPHRLGEDVEMMRADLADPRTLEPCLAGVDSVFLSWPLHTGDALPAVLDSLVVDLGEPSAALTLRDRLARA